MLSLVEHLEEKVDAPPQWAYIDIASVLWLSHVDERHSGRVYITSHPGPDGYPGQQAKVYEVLYHLASPWSHTVGYSSDLEIVGQMILEALEHTKIQGE